jgi:hypothetical protein
MKKYKAHYVYPSSCPFYKVLALCPTFLILKMNSVTMGVSRELKKFTKWMGKMFLCPYLKVRGPFIAEWQLDNYKLIICISTKGFIWPVGPDLRWSIHRGHLEASMVFGPTLECFGDEVFDTLEGS